MDARSSRSRMKRSQGIPAWVDFATDPCTSKWKTDLALERGRPIRSGKSPREGKRNEALDTKVCATAALHGLISMDCGSIIGTAGERRVGDCRPTKPPRVTRSAKCDKHFDGSRSGFDPLKSRKSLQKGVRQAAEARYPAFEDSGGADEA